jgi:hypothetical protein
MEDKCGYPRETLEEAGYEELEVLSDGLHILLDTETGKREVWAEHPDYAGYALIYGDTELEYCYTFPDNL